MKTVNMHEAKSKLSGLVRSIEDGSESEVVICRSGQPVARIIAIGVGPRRQLGADRGRIAIAPDFDSVNDEIAALFEGS
jgi:antitoxin (DNA-binding transcriptional repressor) of toxin-antitoxin stability system